MTLKKVRVVRRILIPQGDLVPREVICTLDAEAKMGRFQDKRVAPHVEQSRAWVVGIA